MGRLAFFGRTIIWSLVLVSSLAVAAGEEDAGDDGAVPDVARRSLCRDLFAAINPDYQQALIDIAEDHLGEARAKVARSEFTDEQKLLLWRLMLGRDSSTAIQALPDFKFSQRALEEVTSDIAAKDPEAALALVPQMRGGPNELFTLLRILAEKIELAPVVDRFGELSEDQRADLAVLQIRAFGYKSFIKRQEFYAVGSANSMAKVMEALIEKGWYSPEVVVGYFEALPQFSSEQKQRLALAYVKTELALGDWLNFVLLKSFGIEDFPAEVQAKLAGILFAKFANTNGWDVQNFSYLFKENNSSSPFTLTRTQTTEILTSVLESVDRRVLRDREARDSFLFQLYNGRVMALGAAVPKLKKAIFARDGLATIAEHYNLETLGNLHLVDEAETLDLSRALLRFAEENPELLPPNFVTILWDPVRNQEVVLKMLKEYLSQNQAKWDHMPENSMDLIAQVTGLDYVTLRESRLQRNPTEFYELVMDIQDGLAKPAFGTVKIAPEVYEKRPEFLKLLRAMRDLHQQNGDGTKGWKATWKAIGLVPEVGINVTNMEGFYARAQEALVASIKEKLAGQNINFTYEQFRELEAQWGDLEPIWTLLSRFQSEASWQNEIPALAQVFEASLQGTFHQKKFNGGFVIATRNATSDARLAQAQLSAFTTPAQIEAWIKPRWKVSVADARQAVNEAQQEGEALTAIRAALHTSVEEPLLATLGAVPAALAAEPYLTFRKEAVQPLLTDQLLNGDPIPVVDKMISGLIELPGNAPLEVATAQKILVRFGLEIVANPESSPQEMRGALRLVKTLLTSQKALGEIPETVKQGLGQADRKIKELGATATGEFVLSVLSSDPKFLLTIGDIVQTTSCQNYKTGGHIESLLGYVMDANVQSIVSFAVRQHHFNSASDFNQVIKAQSEGRLADVVFDGNKKMAVFVISRETGEPLRIQSQDLGFAYQRQMVKLGMSTYSNDPMVRLEKSYNQTHAQSSVMQANHNSIIAEIMVEMGTADDGHTMNVSQSRNPGGVYSDRGRGIFTTNYQIP